MSSDAPFVKYVLLYHSHDILSSIKTKSRLPFSDSLQMLFIIAFKYAPLVLFLLIKQDISMAEKLSYLKRGTAYERINAYARMDYIWLIGGIFNIVFSCDRFYGFSLTGYLLRYQEKRIQRTHRHLYDPLSHCFQKSV